MKESNRVFSRSERNYIDIIQDDSGYFRLQEYETKFDPEEEVDYTVPVTPYVGGIYSEFESAKAEAERLMSLVD